jgi:hypothetical protein
MVVGTLNEAVLRISMDPGLGGKDYCDVTLRLSICLLGHLSTRGNTIRAKLEEGVPLNVE